MVKTAQSPECADRIEQVEEAVGARISDLDAAELCERYVRDSQ